MTTPRRILISCNLARFGGCETHVYHLSKHLQASGAEVTLAAQTFELDPAWQEDLRASGVTVVATPFGWNTRARPLRHIWAAGAFATRLRRDYDVLVGIAHGGFHALLTPFVRRRGWTIYNLVTAAMGLSQATLFAMNRMQGVITMSPRIGYQLANTFDIRKPLGALPHLNGRSRELLDTPSATGEKAEIRVAFFGRLSGFKRPDLLLRLWPTLAIGKARLDIYGDGEQLAMLRQMVAERRLEQTVTVHGGYAQSEGAALMRAADLIVLPSMGLEGLPQVLVEAMAAGVPFVATDVGGVADLGEGNPDVLICGTGDDEVKRAIETMVSRIRAGDVDAARLREFHRQHYAFELVAERWKNALFDPSAFFQAR